MAKKNIQDRVEERLRAYCLRQGAGQSGPNLSHQQYEKLRDVVVGLVTEAQDEVRDSVALVVDLVRSQRHADVVAVAQSAFVEGVTVEERALDERGLDGAWRDSEIRASLELTRLTLTPA